LKKFPENNRYHFRFPNRYILLVSIQPWRFL